MVIGGKAYRVGDHIRIVSAKCFDHPSVENPNLRGITGIILGRHTAIRNAVCYVQVDTPYAGKFVDGIMRLCKYDEIELIKEENIMKTKVNETIFDGTTCILPMSSVQHIEKKMTDDRHLEGITIVTDKTKWNFQYATYENAIWLSNHNNEAEEFLNAFSEYVSERDGMQEQGDDNEKINR